MRAVQVTRLEGPRSVEVVDTPDPERGEGEVLIEVHAAGVAFPDVLLTRGQYQVRPDLPFIPGSEVAGVVRGAPADSRVSAGDRVAAFPGFGGFAETISVPEREVLPLPENVTFEAGAALPMNYLTANFALMRRGRLRPGETVLVHGAAGGVGTAAIQIAKARGGRVLAVVSSESKGEVARRAGADEVVPVEGFKDAVRALTDGRGVDIVVDPVGSDRFLDSLRSLRSEGRHLVIGFTGGEIPTVKVNRLLLNNIDVVGVGWGAFSPEEPDFLTRQWQEIFELLEAGRIDPPIGGTYPLEKTAEALEEIDERRATGKLIVRTRE